MDWSLDFVLGIFVNTYRRVASHIVPVGLENPRPCKTGQATITRFLASLLPCLRLDPLLHFRDACLKHARRKLRLLLVNQQRRRNPDRIFSRAQQQHALLERQIYYAVA